MKILKTGATCVLLLIFILSQYSCRTKKFFALEKNRKAADGEITIRSVKEVDESLAFSKIASDSSNQLYKLTIFPVDTFQFSLEEGFKGKALKLEISGTKEHVTKVIDSISLKAMKTEEIGSRQIKNEETSHVIKSNAVDKVWINWWLIGGLTVVGLIYVSLFHRLRKLISK